METDNKKYYKYSEKGIKLRNIELWDKISSYNDIDNFKIKFYLYENDLKETPKCYCGNELKFRDMLNGFNEFCSRKCSLKSEVVKERRKKTSIENWGVDNPSKSDIIKKRVIQTNKEKFGVEYPLQSKEIKDDLKNKFLEKWGVDNPSKLKIVREKAENTNLKKWGVKHAMQSDLIKDKVKKGFLEKWGVENPMFVDSVKEKVRESVVKRWGSLSNENILNKKENTFEEKYGVKNPMNLSIIREKFKETSLKNWGVDNPSKSLVVRKKVSEKNLENLGVDNPFKSDDIKNKIKELNIKKFGQDHHSKNENWRKKNYSISNHNNYIEYIGDGKSIFKCDDGKEHTFEISIDNFISRKDRILCTVCFPMSDSTSICEETLFLFIKEIYNGDIMKSYRDGLEIDIYLPDLKIGFEYNGLYWHSDKWKEKSYHLDKVNFFKSKNIRVINIWEDDWLFKKDIIKSQIRNLVGKSDKIGARKCEVKEVNTKVSVDFLENNHLLGKVGSKLKLGLFYNNELVSLMTFDHYEGRRKMGPDEWNINRFCNKIGLTVVGGASKILNHFIKNYDVSRIISYADYDWSDGLLYKKLGFNIIHIGQPDYKYVISGKRCNKSKFRKNEKYNMKDCLKVYDSGKIKFEKIILNH